MIFNILPQISPVPGTWVFKNVPWMNKRPTAWDAEKFWLFIHYASFQFPACVVNISDLETNDLYQHSHKTHELFAVYHPSFDFFSSIVFFSQTAPQLLIKAPSCCSHGTQHSLIPLVLSIAMSRHLFVTRLLGASQLERLNIIVHFCKDTLHGCLPRVPFLCASCRAQAASPTQFLPDQLLIFPLLLSLIISRLNLISGNWIPSWRWKTAPQRSHNCSLLLGGYSSWRWQISVLWNQHTVRLRAPGVKITCSWGEQYLHPFTYGICEGDASQVTGFSVVFCHLWEIS